MASQGVAENPNSKLSQLRMRFQQKNQQELEQRRRELNTANENGNGTHLFAEAIQPSATANRLVGNGKVRQMFDDRRRGAGIDRSNPLKPIGSSTSTAERRTPPRPTATGATNARLASTRLQQQQLTKGMTTMSLNETSTAGRRASNDNNNNHKYNAGGAAAGARLRPVVTKKSPPVTGGYSARTASTPTSGKLAPRLTAGQQRPPVQSVKTPTKRANVQSPSTKIRMSDRLDAPSAARSTKPAPEGTTACRYCGRHFNSERLGKHEAVCQRTMTTKRKIFDASKQRVKGTDAEKFTKRPGGVKSIQSYTSAAQQMHLNTSVKKNNWRKKHEEFINAIRAAKQVQAHLARGGKLSDLPPPPPSENPDYIQCPHCGRRFNQQAAERHIPRCATMIHNKPRRDTVQVKKR